MPETLSSTSSCSIDHEEDGFASTLADSSFFPDLGEDDPDEAAIADLRSEIAEVITLSPSSALNARPVVNAPANPSLPPRGEITRIALGQPKSAASASEAVIGGNHAFFVRASSETAKPSRVAAGALAAKAPTPTQAGTATSGVTAATSAGKTAPLRIGSGRLVQARLTLKPGDPASGSRRSAGRFRWDLMLTAACGTAVCGMGCLWLLRAVLS